MNLTSFSKRYVEIIEDVVGVRGPKIPKRPWIATELELQLKELFKHPATPNIGRGLGYHFGLMRDELGLVGLSSICLNSIVMPDIIYRYCLVANHYSPTSKRRYCIVGDFDREKLLRYLSIYIDGLSALKPFIEDGVIQIVPHSCMSVPRSLISVADRMSAEYSKLASGYMTIDEQFDRALNYIMIDAERSNGIPFTDWSYGLQYLEDKLRTLALWNDLRTASPEARTFYKLYRYYSSRFDDAHKLSIMPRVLRRFDYVKSYVGRKMARREYDSLIKVRDAYRGFRHDFFSLIEEVSKHSGDKRSIEEIVNSVEGEIRKEMRLARRSVRAWEIVKEASSIASTTTAYVSLDPIGSLLSIPGLPDQIRDLKETWIRFGHKPNKVVMLIKRIEHEEKSERLKAIVRRRTTR